MEPINIRRRDLLETPHTQSEADGVFTTDMVAPLESLEVTLEPTQGGSGTPAPDNVRPIIGKTEVTVLQRAKNLFDFSEPFRSSGLYYGRAVGSSIEPGSSSNVETSVNNNVITVTTKAGWNGVCYRSPDVPNGTYTLKFNITLVDWTGSQNGRDIYVVDKNNIITRVIMHTTSLSSTTTTITLTGDESAVAISLGGRSSAYGTFQISNLQLELGSTATDYTPFVNGGTYSVTFPALGKNLYDCAEFSSYKQADGTYRLTGADATGIKVYFPEDLIGKELVLSVYLDLTKETGPSYIRLRAVIDGTNKNGGTVNNNNAGYSTITVTPTSTSDYFYMTYGSNGNNYYTFSQFQVEIKTGSGRTSYEPYTNTVYGGTVDIASGVLTVTHQRVVLDGSESPVTFPWQLNYTASGWVKALYRRLSQENIPPGYQDIPIDYYCDKAKPMSIPGLRTSSEYGFGTYDNNSYGIILLMKIEDVGTTLESLNAYLAQNPFTIVYPLLKPVTYQLSPTQVMSLPKDNVFLSEDGSITFSTHWRHTISLPSEYQRIQYLESTGTQYINTGKIPTDNTRMQLKYYTTSTGSFYCAGARSGSSTIYFAQSGATSGAKVSCTVNGTSVTAEDSEGVDFKRVSSGQLFEIMIQTNTDSTYDYSIVDYTHNKYFRTTGVSYTPMGTVSNPIHLFALNTSYVVTGTNRCYYFKLYRDGRIILDGVPCYRKSDGVAGLYDLVTGTFFTNSGTGDFVKGPDI